jgi:CHAD domain-containing protein
MSGLHRLRIRAKKLRYAAEFFRALYRAKAAKRQIADLAEIQDCLGVVNDAAIGRALLAEAGGAEHDRAQALIEDWFAAREEDHLSRFDARWRPYAKAAPFWRDNGNLARTDDAA